MTSFGDMFVQSYEAVEVDENSKSRDRTCSAGPGCGSVKPPSSYLSAVCSWLEEAQKQLSSSAATETGELADSTRAFSILSSFKCKCSIGLLKTGRNVL
jgi:hypothetical protein